MSILWKLSPETTLTVILNYAVFKAPHKVQMYLKVFTEAEIAPEKLAEEMGNSLIETYFGNILSKNSKWLSITLLCQQGKITIPLNSVGTGDLDVENILRFSLFRYNRDYPVSFILYGIKKNLDPPALSNALMELATTQVSLTPEILFGLLGFAKTAQITDDFYVVNKLIALPKQQTETLAKLVSPNN